MLGPANSTTANVTDLIGSEKIVLYVICAMVIYFGFQPKYILHISEASVNNLLEIIRLKCNRLLVCSLIVKYCSKKFVNKEWHQLSL